MAAHRPRRGVGRRLAVPHLCAAVGAEFSVAQGVYVDTGSGWFSDRTVRYLAPGRPALVQDTGFSRTLPTGHGLLAFRTLDQAVAGAGRPSPATTTTPRRPARSPPTTSLPSWIRRPSASRPAASPDPRPLSHGSREPSTVARKSVNDVYVTPEDRTDARTLGSHSRVDLEIASDANVEISGVTPSPGRQPSSLQPGGNEAITERSWAVVMPSGIWLASRTLPVEVGAGRDRGRCQLQPTLSSPATPRSTPSAGSLRWTC